MPGLQLILLHPAPAPASPVLPEPTKNLGVETPVSRPAARLGSPEAGTTLVRPSFPCWVARPTVEASLAATAFVLRPSVSWCHSRLCAPSPELLQGAGRSRSFSARPTERSLVPADCHPSSVVPAVTAGGGRPRGSPGPAVPRRARTGEAAVPASALAARLRDGGRCLPAAPQATATVTEPGGARREQGGATEEGAAPRGRRWLPGRRAPGRTVWRPGQVRPQTTPTGAGAGRCRPGFPGQPVNRSPPRSAEPAGPGAAMCAAEVDAHVAQRYLLKRRLGKGAYGIVWKAVDQRTGEVVAIKKIFDAFRDQTDAQRTFREIMLLREFGDHPNIIRLLDVIPAENDRDIYLVFEFMDTDLNAVIRKGSVLEDTHKRFIFYQLLQATRFLHSGHVIHRDLKPSNVLLDANCRVKLCDFGLARSLSNLPEGPEGGALTEYVATRWYRAPEVLLSSPWYTLGVDMWSLGCILGEMLRGQPLFPGTSTVHQLELILETIPPPTEEDLRALGAGYSCTLLHLLGSRPQQSLDDILPPDTPPDALDLLRKLLVFAPSKRLSAAQALQHPYVRRFHCPSREWTHDSEVWLPELERDQLSASEYRSRLYQKPLVQPGTCLDRAWHPSPNLCPQEGGKGPLGLRQSPPVHLQGSHPGPPGRFWSPDQAAGCSAPQPGRGPRELPGLRLGATPRLMGQCAAQRWTACPCFLDLTREGPTCLAALPQHSALPPSFAGLHLSSGSSPGPLWGSRHGLPKPEDCFE
uniref:mitogen-activated protein kinase 15 isoform X5 n=1 Tax=Ictidomys tridecemlineatus TaxID=43179 RepID=UPI001A9E91D1|nr:mitogen-activated protein kinase 15 isoform X5 [Ictidomys tridecemlineatus]